MKKSYMITDPAEAWVTTLAKDTFRFGQKINKRIYKQKQKFDILLSDPSFIERVDTIRRTFRIPDKGFTSFQDCLKWAINLYKKENMLKSFKNNIKTIFPIEEKNKIGERWWPAVEYFILFNRADADHLFPNQVDFGVEERGGELILGLEIYKDTTMDDIKAIWPQIEDHKKILGRVDKMKKDKMTIKAWQPKRFGEYENFLKYKKAFELKNQGRSYNYIASELGIGYSEVGTYIKRFNKAIEENNLF